MVSFPPCKINLGLRILRKRADGYHDIETCFYPVPFTDILEIIRSDKTDFASTGLDIPGSSEDNLCLKAYHLLSRDYPLGPVRFHLHKLIPTGAGLGGGSSDAAFTLRTLNDVFDLNLTPNQLSHYAAQIGSDCSFFINDEAMMGSGRGEILTRSEVSLKGLYMVLINPGIHVSTAAAYAGVQIREHHQPLEDLLSAPIEQWRETVQNDFETTVFKQFPLIGELKKAMYDAGAFYAAMSGSGSSVFGLFKSEVSLRNDHHFNSMIIWKGYL